MLVLLVVQPASVHVSRLSEPAMLFQPCRESLLQESVGLDMQCVELLRVVAAMCARWLSRRLAHDGLLRE